MARAAELSQANAMLDVSDNKLSEWSAKDAEEGRKALELAKQFQVDSAKASNPVRKASTSLNTIFESALIVHVTSQWRVLPEWREEMAAAMLNDVGSEIHSRVCPPAAFPIDKSGRPMYFILGTANIAPYTHSRLLLDPQPLSSP